MAYKRLGDLLIDAGLISNDQLDLALSHQKGSNRRLGEVLIDEGIITEAQLIEALQMQLGIEFIDLSQYDIDPEMSRVISKNVARTYSVVPVKATPEEVFLAMSDPLNFLAIEAVKTASRKRVVPMVATNDAIQRAIMTLYGNEGAARAIEEMKREVKASDEATTFTSSTLGDDADAQSADRTLGEQHNRAGGHRACERHSPRAARSRHACAHAHRRHHAHHPYGAEGAAAKRYRPLEDHGHDEHFGTAHSPGWPCECSHQETGHRSAHINAADHPRRDGGYPPAR